MAIFIVVEKSKNPFEVFWGDESSITVALGKKSECALTVIRPVMVTSLKLG